MSKDNTTALDKLLPQIRELITQARSAAMRTVNTLQVVTNFEIGRIIVVQEQRGAERAEYGKALLKELSTALTVEFGIGFSRTNIEYMRRFYLTYRERAIPISQTPSGKSSALQKTQTLSVKTESPFTLSWSHYLFLMGIKNPDERSFYEIEAT